MQVSIFNGPIFNLWKETHSKRSQVQIRHCSAFFHEIFILMIFGKLFGHLPRLYYGKIPNGICFPKRFYGVQQKNVNLERSIDVDKDGNPYTDNDGRPFGMEPSDPVDWNRRIYVTFYLGGLAFFCFLYQYVPDTS